MEKVEPGEPMVVPVGCTCQIRPLLRVGAMSEGGTSGSTALSQSGMVGTVLQVVARNSGSRVTRSALLVMSSVVKWLRWEGVNPALHAGSVRESRGGIAQVVP